MKVIAVIAAATALTGTAFSLTDVDWMMFVVYGACMMLALTIAARGRPMSISMMAIVLLLTAFAAFTMIGLFENQLDIPDALVTPFSASLPAFAIVAALADRRRSVVRPIMLGTLAAAWLVIMGTYTFSADLQAFGWSLVPAFAYVGLAVLCGFWSRGHLEERAPSRPAHGTTDARLR